MTMNKENLPLKCLLLLSVLHFLELKADLVTFTATACLQNELEITPISPSTELENVATPIGFPVSILTSPIQTNFDCSLLTENNGFPLISNSPPTIAEFSLNQGFFEDSFAVALTVSTSLSLSSSDILPETEIITLESFDGFKIVLIGNNVFFTSNEFLETSFLGFSLNDNDRQVDLHFVLIIDFFGAKANFCQVRNELIFCESDDLPIELRPGRQINNIRVQQTDLNTDSLNVGESNLILKRVGFFSSLDSFTLIDPSEVAKNLIGQLDGNLQQQPNDDFNDDIPTPGDENGDEVETDDADIVDSENNSDTLSATIFFSLSFLLALLVSFVWMKRISDVKKQIKALGNSLEEPSGDSVMTNEMVLVNL